MMIRMNPVDREISYANNSVAQGWIISKIIRPTMDDAMKDMFSKIVPTSTFTVADLGCASGANTLMIVSQVIDSIQEICQQSQLDFPEIQVFLNDLPGNDFNSIFRSVPTFFERLKEAKGDMAKPCFIVGVPGSFYGRIFPSRSLHFVNSSISLQWLTKVPSELGNSNKGNVCLTQSSSPNVFKAYAEQFEKDFTLFLSSRSEEMIPGGRMVLSFLGRNNPNPWKCENWSFELLARSLLDLVTEGLVREADVDSFNIPLYNPHTTEVREITEREGSFRVNKLEHFEMDSDPRDDVDFKENVLEKYQRGGQNIARAMRAVTEQIISAHFGNAIVERLFSKYAAYVAEQLAQNKGKIVIILISVTKT